MARGFFSGRNVVFTHSRRHKMNWSSLQTVTANMNVHLEHKHERMILTSPIIWGNKKISAQLRRRHLSPEDAKLTISPRTSIRGPLQTDVKKEISPYRKGHKQ